MKLNTTEVLALESIGSYLNVPLAFEWLKQNTGWEGSRTLYPDDEFYEDLAVPIDLSNRVQQEGFDLLRRTARELYPLPKKTRVHIKGLEEMTNCTMNPIRVTVELGGRDEQFYIKDPDPKRFYGKAFHNLLLDGKAIQFSANGGCIVAQTVPGVIFEDSNPNDYKKRDFLESQAKLEVFMNLILLHDVVGNERNYTVDSEGHIHLLDFNQCLQDGYYKFEISEADEHKERLSSLRDIERGNIYRAFRRNERTIEKFLAALTERDTEYKVANKFGYNDMAKLVEHRIQLLNPDK